MPSICRYLWPITNQILLCFAPSACQLDALPRLGHRLGQIVLSHRCVKKPWFTIWVHQLGVVSRIAIVLTECIAGLVLVNKMPDVNTHPYIFKPRVSTCKRLLLCLAVWVVNEMFGLLSVWTWKYTLYKQLPERCSNIRSTELDISVIKVGIPEHLTQLRHQKMLLVEILAFGLSSRIRLDCEVLKSTI